jgi:2-polyprenyl-3-methyl-5-hydroxy-6-metoxy-1,4-benzoquinol methylase
MANDYALGYSTEEERRLVQQAEIFEPLTVDVLRHAGIGSNMRVLDIGCGVGDRREESMLTARRRAKSLGIDNVTFIAADIASFATEKTFEAIVGRLILLYFPNPSATVRRLSSSLRQDGIMVFQEMDMSAFASGIKRTFRERLHSCSYCIEFPGSWLQSNSLPLA